MYAIANLVLNFATSTLRPVFYWATIGFIVLLPVAITMGYQGRFRKLSALSSTAKSSSHSLQS